MVRRWSRQATTPEPTSELVLHDARVQSCKVTRVWSDGKHNAFPGLCKWKGAYYLAFRHAHAHNPDYPYGRITVLKSDDPADWLQNDVQTLWSGGDDRDPFFLPTIHGLALCFGSYTLAETELHTIRYRVRPLLLISHSCLLLDETQHQWSDPMISSPWNQWVWSGIPVTDRDDSTLLQTGTVLGASYSMGYTGDNCTIRLHQSRDGLCWYNIGELRDEGTTSLTEPVLAYDEDAEQFLCIARREVIDTGLVDQDEPQVMLLPVLGISEDALRWKWDYLNLPMHPASCIWTPHGMLLAGRTEAAPYSNGRYHYRTTIFALDAVQARCTPLVTLPSKGDCAYPSMIWDEERQEVLVAYYSQHEVAGHALHPLLPPVQADIYLARIALKE